MLIGYALGMVPGARIVARRHGIDLRITGDGNPGAWNALEALGWVRAWPAFAIDGLKGLLAAVLGWIVVGAGPVGASSGALLEWLPWDGLSGADLGSWLPWACVGAAMLGHAFPLPRPADGGKAVMAFGGGAIGLVPIVGVPLLGVFLIAVALHRAALGARLAVFAFPFLQAAVTPIEQVAWTGGLMTLIGLLFAVRSGDRRRAA